MKEEANNQQTKMEDLITQIADSEGLSLDNIISVTDEMAEKASKIMFTYLGESPDEQEALEFLCLAENAEVTHYEVLSSMAKKVKSRKFETTVRSILKEEIVHLKLCTKYA